MIMMTDNDSGDDDDDNDDGHSSNTDNSNKRPNTLSKWPYDGRAVEAVVAAAAAATSIHIDSLQNKKSRKQCTLSKQMCV